MSTLPELNITSENRPGPKRKCLLPAIDFQGRAVSFREGTLQGINISHLGKRKIIFKMPFLGDMLVPWRVIVEHAFSRTFARFLHTKLLAQSLC